MKREIIKIIKGIFRIVTKIFKGLSRELGKWDKKRTERLRYEDSIKKRSYLQEKGRIQAREDMREHKHREKLGWEIMSRQRASPLQEAFFGSKPKKRRRGR